jgi:hypothetical protein
MVDPYFSHVLGLLYVQAVFEQLVAFANSEEVDWAIVKTLWEYVCWMAEAGLGIEMEVADYAVCQVEEMVL